VNKALTNSSILFVIIGVVFGAIFSYMEITSQDAFGFEENFVTLQTGIISTDDRDFVISNDLESRIFKNGKIMRLSGVTTTGEPYYIYQKNISENIILKGKILVGGTFVPIIQKQISPEPILETQVQEQIPMKMIIKQPHSSYWRQDYTINVKTFEADKNPLNDYWYKEYLVPNVPIFINITHENGNHLTTIEGITNEDGYFQGSHYITENRVQSGKYFVHVVAGDEKSGDIKDLTTFVIAEIAGARPNNDPKSLPTFNPPPTVLTAIDLIGSNSYDPNGFITDYLWAQTAGPIPAPPASPMMADTTFTPPLIGTYKFTLTVTDNDGNTDTSELTIIVTI
jgi:hypothetical protein